MWRVHQGQQKWVVTKHQHRSSVVVAQHGLVAQPLVVDHVLTLVEAQFVRVPTLDRLAHSQDPVDSGYGL